MTAVAVSADGRRAVSADGSYATPAATPSSEATVRVWDLATGKWVAPASQRLRHWFRQRRLPRRQQHGSASSKSSWDRPSAGGRAAAAVSADGRRAVSGGDDGTVRVWDLDTGALLHTLTGHDGGVNAVAVSADGRRAVSGGSDDGTVRVWDLEEGVEFAFFAADSTITELAVTPAGTRVIAGTSTGPVHLLELCGYEYASGQPPAQEPRP